MIYGLSLAKLGENKVAIEVLSSAAKFEEYSIICYH